MADHEEMRRLLIDKHWSHAQLIAKERMWLAGIYLAAWAFWFPKYNQEWFLWACPLVVMALSFFGLAFNLKLNYLYEIHIHRAESYAFGGPKGGMTDFGGGFLAWASLSYLFPLLFLLGLWLAVIWLIVANISSVAWREHHLFMIGFFFDVAIILAIILWKTNGKILARGKLKGKVVTDEQQLAAFGQIIF